MSSLSYYFDAGGPLMWPIAACSVALLAVAIERLWTLLLRHRVLKRELPASRLSAHRRVLPFFAEVPPALGLLGTVVGLVQSFLSSGSRLNGDAVAGGLAVACLTTIAGLGIGLTSTVLGYCFEAMIRPEAASRPEAVSRPEARQAG